MIERPLLRWVGILALSSLSTSWATREEILGGHEGWLDRMGAGIRELGYGNAASASPEALPAAYWNPALLPFSSRRTGGMGADIRALQRHGGYVGLQGRATGNMGMGIAIVSRGDWEVEAYDSDETPLGTASPRAMQAFVGLGVRTSRVNGYGVSVSWYHSTLDINGGSGDIDQVGIFNLGWYRQWQPNLRTALVIRNLGINERLSSGFVLTTIAASGASDLDRTGRDFLPKTVIASINYRREIAAQDLEFFAEAIDYQLKDELFVVDGNFHHQDFRFGVNWYFQPWLQFRAGYDRGNLSGGMGFEYAWSRSNTVYIDYALLVERNFVLFNPYGLGLRYYF